MIGRKGSCVYWRPSKAAQKQARPESVIRKRSNCTTLLTNGRDVAELEDAEAAIASLEAASQSPHLRDCIHSDSVPNSRKSEVKRQLSCGFLDDDGDAWEPWEDVRSAHGPAALSGRTCRQRKPGLTASLRKTSSRRARCVLLPCSCLVPPHARHHAHARVQGFYLAWTMRALF
jgi:hypothetical protein